MTVSVLLAIFRAHFGRWERWMLNTRFFYCMQMRYTTKLTMHPAPPQIRWPAHSVYFYSFLSAGSHTAVPKHVRSAFLVITGFSGVSATIFPSWWRSFAAPGEWSHKQHFLDGKCVLRHVAEERHQRRWWWRRFFPGPSVEISLSAPTPSRRAAADDGVAGCPGRVHDDSPHGAFFRCRRGFRPWP